MEYYNHILSQNMKTGKNKRKLNDVYIDLVKQAKKDYGEKTTVLLQVGQFYELYANDLYYYDELKKIGEILNFVIGFKQDYYMVGFPIHSQDKNIDQLLNHDYTLVIVDQESNIKNTKRIVKCVINNSTNIQSNNKNNYIINIFFDVYKNNYTVGLSSIDISTNKLYVYEFGDKDKKILLDEVYHFIKSFDVNEIIIYNNILHTENEIINRLEIVNIKTKFEETNNEYINIYNQEHFLNKLFVNKSQLHIFQYLGIDRNNIMRNSLVCLLNYLEKFNISLIKNCNIPEIWNNHKFLNIVNDGFYQLDIISKNKSLIDIVNYTSTNLGYRFLKNSILIPICDETILNKRYNSIEILINNNKYIEYENYLKDINDIEKLHRKITLNKILPSEIFNIYISYKNIIELYKLSLRDNLKLNLNDSHIKQINNIVDKIKTIFDIELLSSTTSLYNIHNSFFKRNYDNKLDELEDKKNNIKNILHIKIKNKIDNIFNITNSSIKCSDKETYINITSKKSFNKTKIKTFEIDGYIFSENNFTSKIQSSNVKINHPILTNLRNEYDNCNDIFIEKIHEVYNNYIIDFDNKYNDIYNDIVQFVSKLDFYKSSAKCAIKHSYVKPIIDYSDNNSYIDCKDIRHPIIEQINTSIPYIGNDIVIGKDDNGFLLYGVNSIGKSSLMKSVGLSIVMAQSGMYVPCSYMKYNPFENIYTRINNNDDLYNGLSSFGVECTELRTIYKKANKKSIIIGDEICNGTETQSAIKLVYATLLKLLKLNTNFIFATHLHELNDIEDLDIIRKHHLSIKYDGDKLIFDRKLKDGSGKRDYGIEVAKSFDLPEDVLELANNLGKNKNIIDNFKKSNYNNHKILDLCEMCKVNKADDTHHIKEQKLADSNNMIGNINKNIKNNLTGLCKECHNKITYNKIDMTGYKQTSEGIELDYKEKKEEKIKKFTNDLPIINKLLNKHNINNCKLLLKELHNIEISNETLNKIKNNNY